MPVKIYNPEGDGGPFPLIIFSHGLGGSRETYGYLGRHWAGAGHICVHVQHVGSDAAIWRTADAASRSSLEKIPSNPVNITNRTRDISFVIDQMIGLNSGNGPFHGKIDGTAIGVGGHSFGAMTALQSAGQVFWENEKQTLLADPRVKAVIAMSTPISEQVKSRADETFMNIKVPCLHLTGTQDIGMAPTPLQYRRLPFDRIDKADQYLITFDGGDHMVFVGRRLLDRQLPKDGLFHHLILESTTAFWNAYLKGDAAAKTWLADGAFQAELGNDGVFEKKLR